MFNIIYQLYILTKNKKQPNLIPPPLTEKVLSHGFFYESSDFIVELFLLGKIFYVSKLLSFCFPNLIVNSEHILIEILDSI